MSDLDRKIRAALQEDEAAILAQFDEQTLPEQVIETFRGKNRWLVVISFLITIGWLAFGVFAAIRFFQAEQSQHMMAWAGAFGFSILAVAMVKIWFWMELNRIAITREIKRVELQMAYLAQELRKTT